MRVGLVGANRVVIEGATLFLGPGMRVNMCGDLGADSLIGEFEELSLNGEEVRIPIRGRRMNIRLSESMTLFTKY
ncbi:hypothetical protein BH09MYX1_BH09MYX1_52190 [soil metagenome]